MSWIKIDDQMVDHPKIANLPCEAFWWLHQALSYASRHRTDGVLPPAFLGRVPKPVRRKLVARKVWERWPDGSTRIHDYLEYQPSRAALNLQREQTKDRVKKWRETHQGSNGVGNGVRNGVSNGAPVPSRPVPSRSKKNPPTPLADAKGVRVLRKHYKVADTLRARWGYCQHQPTCETTASCVALIAKTLATKKPEIRA